MSVWALLKTHKVDMWVLFYIVMLRRFHSVVESPSPKMCKVPTPPSTPPPSPGFLVHWYNKFSNGVKRKQSLLSPKAILCKLLVIWYCWFVHYVVISDIVPLCFSCYVTLIVKPCHVIKFCCRKIDISSNHCLIHHYSLQ